MSSTTDPSSLDRIFKAYDVRGTVPDQLDDELAEDPGATVIHNLITSRAVPEIVAERGGRAVRSRFGHSYIKATMAETNAVFGGEHSGHFYFRDFWRADSGMLAALHTMAALAEQDEQGVLRRVEEAYADEPGVEIDHLDGLTVTHDDWWFNVRASNTEPLLRLNAEGADEQQMTAVRDRVLTMIRSS